MKRLGLKIGIIGVGHLGEALLAGFIRKNIFRPGQIGVSSRNPHHLASLKRKYKTRTFSSNRELVRSTSCILLSVRPTQMRELLLEIGGEIRHSHLVISVAAGLNTSFYRRFLPRKTRLIRVMPNTPVVVGEGAAVLYATAQASGRDRRYAKKIFSSVAKTSFVSQEELLDPVTALVGCGPAFVYLFLLVLAQAGKAQGLPEVMAQRLAIQTLLGAGRLAQLSTLSPGQLIAQVASKGGTTEAGLKVLAKGGFVKLIRQTIAASTRRARELSKEAACTS